MVCVSWNGVVLLPVNIRVLLAISDTIMRGVVHGRLSWVGWQDVPVSKFDSVMAPP